jgi:uncharacterized membrane protein YkvA (DUF1232 family)
MADKKKIYQYADKGFIQNLTMRIKLILRLMADSRVNFLLKLLPIGALIYLVSPIDLIPGAVIPFIGALDDAAVVWLGITLFVNLCPEEVVQEHMEALQKVINSSWRNAPEQNGADEVIDVEAHEVQEEEN